MDRINTIRIFWVDRVEVNSKELVIINAYAQYQWRGSGRKADYKSVRQVFRLIKQDYPGKRIGYPALGAGLAEEDLTIIAAIINEELVGKEHVFVQWEK